VDAFDAFFRFHSEAEEFPLVSIRRSPTTIDDPASYGAQISVTLNPKDEKQLRGKFCSKSRESSQHRNKDNKYDINFLQGSFSVSSCGEVTTTDKNQNGFFLQQIEYIKEALGRFYYHMYNCQKSQHFVHLIPPNIY